MNESADRSFAAVSGGDTQALTRMYASDARIRRNDQNSGESVGENPKAPRRLSRTVENPRYEDIRRYPLPDAQQHIVRGDLPGHGPLEVPIGLVVQMRDGRIIQSDEYVDSTAIHPLYAVSTSARER